MRLAFYRMIDMGDPTSSNLENKGIKEAVDMYQENLEGSLWWMQDNEYIYRGYRSQLTVWESIKRYEPILLVQA